MKKIITVLLCLCMAVSAITLAGCDNNTEADTTANVTDNETAGTEATDTEDNSIQYNVPDVTLNYVAADIYADKETAEAKGLTVADNPSISGWFKESTEIDENTWEVIIPEEFSHMDGYVMRIARGQYIEEVDVFKMSDGTYVEGMKALAEYRCAKKKSNNDYKLYDDANGTNAKMIETGKVVVIGNFVIYAITENTDVSVLRAQKYVQDNPDCTAYELYKAIVIEE